MWAIIIGIVIILILISGRIDSSKNLEFEYKIYNTDLFKWSMDYNQYLKEGNVDEELKDVFRYNNVSLSDDARMSKSINENYWEINDNRRRYIIGDITEKQLNVRDDLGGGYIKNIEWKENTLIIDAVMRVACDYQNLKLMGDYKVNGDTISLTVSQTKSYFLKSRCMGDYGVRFKIKNLEKKDYTILLYQVDEGKSLIDEKSI